MKKIPDILLNRLNKRTERLVFEVNENAPDIIIDEEVRLIHQVVTEIEKYRKNEPFELLVDLEDLGVDDSILDDSVEELKDLLVHELFSRYGQVPEQFDFEGTGMVNTIRVFDIKFKK